MNVFELFNNKKAEEHLTKKLKDVINEAIPVGSAEPLSVGDKVIARDANRDTYGKQLTVKKIDGDTIFAGGPMVLTLPYRRQSLQLVNVKQMHEDSTNITKIQQLVYKRLGDEIQSHIGIEHGKKVLTVIYDSNTPITNIKYLSNDISRAGATMHVDGDSHSLKIVLESAFSINEDPITGALVGGAIGLAFGAKGAYNAGKHAHDDDDEEESIDESITIPGSDYTGPHSPAEQATRRQKEAGPKEYNSWLNHVVNDPAYSNSNREYDPQLDDFGKDLDENLPGPLSSSDYMPGAIVQPTKLFRVLVTMIDKNHPMVSKRAEQIQKHIRIHAPDEYVAPIKAKIYYNKRGMTVMNAETVGEIKEGAKVDRMVSHIKKSEKGSGKSDKEAENIAWATANKRGMLDNKNKKVEDRADDILNHPAAEWVLNKFGVRTQKQRDTDKEQAKKEREEYRASIDKKLQADKKKHQVTEAEDGISAQELGNAITNRLMQKHPDIISRYGVEVLADAINEVAVFHVRSLDIGTSDINIMVKEVIKRLEGYNAESVTESGHSDTRMERMALKQLQALPQPISVNGGSYAYSCNVGENPLAWVASDGSQIHPKSLRELGEWFEHYAREEWDAFIDGYCDAKDLVSHGIIRKRPTRDQDDHETLNMRGESIEDTADKEIPGILRKQALSPEKKHTSGIHNDGETPALLKKQAMITDSEMSVGQTQAYRQGFTIVCGKEIEGKVYKIHQTGVGYIGKADSIDAAKQKIDQVRRHKTIESIDESVLESRMYAMSKAGYEFE